MDGCKITFLPWGSEAVVPEGTDLLAAAMAADVRLYNSCGGEGVCGRCKVIVKEGPVKTELSGRLTEQERAAGYVLACRTTVHGDVAVEVPPESRMEREQILTEEAKVSRLAGLFSRAEEVERMAEGDERTLFAYSPLVTKLFLKLPVPTLQDNVSDLERLYREIRRHREIPIMQTGLSNIKKLGRLLRDSKWEVTVTLGMRNGTTEVVLIEPGDTSERNFGIALDIGTTTVAANLVDLTTSETLGVKATHNRQASYGEDVITRIIHAEKGDGLERLHHAVVDTVNDLIAALLAEHGVSLNEVTAVTCAGNMTMVHLLLRVDPYFIRREPYVPTANFMPVIRAAEAGIKLNPRALLSCLPGISSYVGGDITAGVLASGLDAGEGLFMLIDIGTNGEIVLGNKEWLVCCAASAGPAFEGSGVHSGVRAMAGAIQKVQIDPGTYELTLSTIGEGKPIGICGSGYVDAVAALLQSGIIDRSGKIRTTLPKALADLRIKELDGELAFALATDQESATGHDVLITEVDIMHLIRSKGAIYTASKVLAERMGVTLADLDKFYIGGGFGNYLNIEKAIWIGLLPDLPLERFEFIGNSSLTGARMALLSHDARAKAREIAEKMTYIELSVEPSYMQEYVGSLFLPHTDIDLFPTVKQTLRI
ncbi:MAG: ASKHA domain-containing protein [Candidatus Latescibacterota bacterium]